MPSRKRKASEVRVAGKPPGYFRNTRAETVADLPVPLGRVLDVGCGAGSAGWSFRDAGATELVGIELDPDEAAAASETYDEVLCGDALEVVERAGWFERFDTIACYDVLEHLADPLPLVEALRGAASPGGWLHVSVPNARHYSLARDLVFRGTFGYTQFGHRDLTHLRWFTRRDVEQLVDEAGWSVVSATPSLPGRLAAADRLTAGIAREFLAFQWRVLAVA